MRSLCYVVDTFWLGLLSVKGGCYIILQHNSCQYVTSSLGSLVILAHYIAIILLAGVIKASYHMNRNRELYLLFPDQEVIPQGYCRIYAFTSMNDEPPYKMCTFWGTGNKYGEVYEEDGESLFYYLILLLFLYLLKLQKHSLVF